MEKITGIMMYYYGICHKRLWYMKRGLSMEEESELVSIGKMVDKSSYSRQKKHVMIDNIINIDFLKDWDVIHEVKKSDRLEEASILQIKYYIHVLRSKGVNIEKGILDYPRLRKRTKIQYKESDKREIEKIIKDIKRIINLEVPPKGVNRSYCKKCSYYELCFI